MSMRKGFTQVDGQPDPGMLVAGMEATAQWPAVQRLRAWERERLGLDSGDHVLDVGFGPGDVLAQMAATVGPGGRAAGVDASEVMLAAAAERAERAGVDVELMIGDAMALPFDDATFSAARSERTLQWVPDAAAAVGELARVVRPGGRVCIIDTDWRTFLIDIPSPDLLRRFGEAMVAVRGDQLTVGARLPNLLRDAGFHEVEVAAETHMWTAWDPDATPAPAGMFPLRFVAKDLIEQGLVAAEEAEQMIAEFEQSARDGRLFATLTMFAAAAVKPR